ncbi:hypothetical protein BH23THE1_BH23THE1_29000 [soil metagenome]
MKNDTIDMEVINIHSSRLIGALLKSEFISGRYVNANCRLTIIIIPSIMYLFEKNHKRNNDSIKDRRFNRYVISIITIVFTATVIDSSKVDRLFVDSTQTWQKPIT